jgi:hypothetical protein
MSVELSGDRVRTFIEASGVGAAFEPETVSLMVDAFSDAWKSVQASGAEYTADAYSKAARELLAQHIIAAAKDGERDPHRLSQGAVLYLSHANLKHLRR